MEYWKNTVALIAMRDITKHYEEESKRSNPVSWDNLYNKKTRYLNWLLGVSKANYKGGGNPKKQKQ